MSFLLDTCVLSELTRPRADPNVVRWLRSTYDENKYASVISLGEIRYGIVSARDALRRARLTDWYDHVLKPSFDTRMLIFDEATSVIWATLRAGRPTSPVLDTQIAATALAHGLTLVTRNVKDFRFDGLTVLDPWKP